MLKESKAATAARSVLAEMDPRILIGELDEWVRWRVRLLLFGLALSGYGKARVICAYRSLENCQRLYGQGRTGDDCEAAGVPRGFALPGWNVVTWIGPRDNNHTLRRAVDIDFTMYADLSVQAVNRIAQAVGMIYGGVWSVRDTYHFEI